MQGCCRKRFRRSCTPLDSAPAPTLCLVFQGRLSQSVISLPSRAAYQGDCCPDKISALALINPALRLSLILLLCRNHPIPRPKLAFFLLSKPTVARPFGSRLIRCWSPQAWLAVATSS